METSDPLTDAVTCDWCEGTGTRKFCPSEPDKCAGCETCTCEWCDGKGAIKLA